MEHIKPTPMLRHVRRSESCGRDIQHQASTTSDSRWQLLNLVKACRQRLGLRDRDIAVLRGLFSLLPDDATRDQMTIFASNRVVIDRCDGIDERTLRRRLVHLEHKGLLRRRPSPNGKRYRVRDADNQTHLSYGLDVAPVFELQRHLEALAEECRRESVRTSVLKSKIRDLLFRFPYSESSELREEARLSLRRVVTADFLEALLNRLKSLVEREPSFREDPSRSQQMTVSDSQNDRHIHSSCKEDLESDRSERRAENSAAKTTTWRGNAKKQDITVDECIDLAETSKGMSPTRPRTWEDIIDLAMTLAPAIGLSRSVTRLAEQHLGRHGSALAILGLVESVHRIRSPEAYLRALIVRGQKQSLDLVRMFRSLVGHGGRFAMGA